MDEAEVKAIAAQVKADRKKVLEAMRDPLPLRFTNGRRIDDPTALSEADARQLVAVGMDGVGMALPPAQLLEEGPDEGFYEPEAWDVLDADGRLAYRVYIYGTDNGTICRGETTEILGGMSQGGIELHRKLAKGATDQLIDELVAAALRVPEEEVFEGSCLRFFGE